MRYGQAHRDKENHLSIATTIVTKFYRAQLTKILTKLAVFTARPSISQLNNPALHF